MIMLILGDAQWPTPSAKSPASREGRRHDDGPLLVQSGRGRAGPYNGNSLLSLSSTLRAIDAAVHFDPLPLHAPDDGAGITALAIPHRCPPNILVVKIESNTRGAARQGRARAAAIGKRKPRVSNGAAGAFEELRAIPTDALGAPVLIFADRQSDPQQRWPNTLDPKANI